MAATVNELTVHNCIFNSVISPSKSLFAFTEAPIDLLSIHFTGRRKEPALMAEAFSRPRDNLNILLRCVLFGERGVGKSQLTYECAKSTF